MVRIGQKVSDFEFEIFHENEFKNVKLSDYQGKWLVLLFYPADFTYVCPTELEEAAKFYNDFKEVGAELISVSTDTVYTHLAWHASSPAIKKVNYPMAADPTRKLCMEFGTYNEEDGLSFRGTFIIDPEGILKTMDIHDNSIGRSSKEILRRVKAAKFVSENPGLVCPASWEPGDKTLKKGIDLVGKI